NTTSHCSKPAESGVWNLMSTRPRRLGYMSATCMPSSLREVMARSSTLGCWDRRRKSSTPVYPVPPTIPTLIRVSAADAMANPERKVLVVIQLYAEHENICLRVCSEAKKHKMFHV